MADYGHNLLFGAFITPVAGAPQRVVELTRLAEAAGLDLATFQDHPYQPGFLDTWTLLSYLAARTERIRLTANVLNLPLRQPTVIARSAASLDLLSGGRVELGLGAGAFWDAIEASGGRRLTPGQGVDALAEAIRVIRAVWATDQRGGVRVEGEYYRVVGAKRGPAPAHDIGIWLGAYKPRMLRLTGAAADGWLPSLGYLPGGPAELAAMNAMIDAAAVEADREPAAVRRMLNIGGRFQAASAELLVGPAKQWAQELAEIALQYGISGFILASDLPDELQTFAEDVAPAVRELVAAERGGDERGGAERGGAQRGGEGRGGEEQGGAAEASDKRGGVGTMASVPAGLSVWDESTRPSGPAPPDGWVYSPTGRAVGRHLVDVHDHLRAELEQLRDILQQVKRATMDAGQARSAVNEMTMRQNDWTLGAYCVTYSRTVTQHHSGEDSQIFPHLREADAGLVPVIDRLEQEHHVIHDVLEGVDRALVEFVRTPDDFSGLEAALDLLTETLLSHLTYEEAQICEPLSRYGFYPGQV